MLGGAAGILDGNRSDEIRLVGGSTADQRYIAHALANPYRESASETGDAVDVPEIGDKLEVEMLCDRNEPPKHSIHIRIGCRGRLWMCRRGHPQ